jgi:hypothetical protein
LISWSRHFLLGINKLQSLLACLVAQPAWISLFNSTCFSSFSRRNRIQPGFPSFLSELQHEPTRWWKESRYTLVALCFVRPFSFLSLILLSPWIPLTSTFLFFFLLLPLVYCANSSSRWRDTRNTTDGRTDRS